MAMLRPMSEMKDSGIEWMGQIPDDWDTPKILYVLRGKITDGPHETPHYVESGIPFISIDSLNESKDIDFSICKRFINEDEYLRFAMKTVLEEGDILFSKAASIGKTAIVGKEKFMVWSPLAILKNEPSKVSNQYLYYLLNCSELITAIALSGSVNTQINVGMRELEQARIPLPSSFDEQQAIASYLDDRCSKLDELITEAEKSIEEYKELKQAVIDNAITYGLNHHRELKQSDCEWVRTVPVGWRKIKLGWICSFHNGDRSNRYPSGDDFINEGIPFAGADSLNGTFVDREKCRFIKHAHYESLSGLKIKINDILYTLRGSTIGKCAISDFNDGTVASSLTGIRVERLDDANPMFLLYWLQSICEFNQRTVLINGSTAPNLSAENVRQYKMFLPSRNEQNEIVRYLNEAVKKYDSIIVEKQETVQLLSEYKKSLIYEVVTGKKCVIL